MKVVEVKVVIRPDGKMIPIADKCAFQMRQNVILSHHPRESERSKCNSPVRVGW